LQSRLPESKISRCFIALERKLIFYVLPIKQFRGEG
jgi:hypothetical protein